MYRYVINKEIKWYLRRVIHRCYNCCSIEVEDGQTVCYTDVNPERFKKMHDRARCEKKSDETGRFYMTFRESLNMDEKSDLLNKSEVSAFYVIDDPEGKKLMEYYKKYN